LMTGVAGRVATLYETAQFDDARPRLTSRQFSKLFLPQTLATLRARMGS
jgi:hypothetical protein